MYYIGKPPSKKEDGTSKPNTVARSNDNSKDGK